MARRFVLTVPGVVVIILGVLAGPLVALPVTTTPSLQLARVIHTTPFEGTTTSMRDGEGSAYVPGDDALWLSDDNANRVYELDRTTGALRRVVAAAEFQAAPKYGGGALAGANRAGDLESIAYDPAADVLYVFSAGCCDAAALPTAFRLTRGGDDAFHVESYQALASSNVTAAALHPGDSTLYVGAANSLRPYTYASNTLGAAVGVSGLSGIQGMGFSPDGSDLFVVTSANRLHRVHWATKTIVSGWSFDLTAFGIHDSRAVELIDDQFWVLDGDDARPAGDPMKYGLYVFDVVAGNVDNTPPNTTIDAGASGPTNSASATFTFSSSEPGSTFECRLDGASFAGCASPKDYSGLTETSHTFEVRAIDAANNVDPSPAVRTWSVDTTAPSVTTVAPADLAINVALNSYVQATFSEAIDATTVTAATFSLVRTVDGAPVAATVQFDPTTRKAILDPVANLAPITGYTGRVNTAVRDLAGNRLAADRVWSFVSAATPPAPGPGIRRESTSTVANTSAVNKITITVPAGTAPGDVLVACLALNGGGVASAGVPAGWAPIAAVSTSSTQILGYYKVAGSSEPGTYAWTLNSSVKNGGGIARYSGVDSVVSLDAHATTASGSGSRAGAVPGVATITPNAMLVGCMGIHSAKTTDTITSPGGMGQAWDIGGNRHELADATHANPGSSGSKTWSFSKAQAWAGWLTALRPR